MPLTSHARLRDVYATPMGRDVVDRLLLQAGLPRRIAPALGWMRLSLVERLAARFASPGLVDLVLGLVNQESEAPSDNPAPEPAPWWREAVFYQVYPRSFADSDGDGLGDLRGIIGKLDYLADLGVDCLWLSPIFASPNKDMGYDISDYRAVMTEMGTLDDVDELIAGCHERGMRIILDLVVNHTSDQHAWFQAALKDPDGPFGQYYFLREGSPDAPPNNWRSYFSGPAWRWLPEIDRWALHLFADEQLDLNWDNPTVRGEVADVVAWWMRRGVDGFRLDVINYISKTSGLPDGHPFVGQLLEFTGAEHYFYGPRLHEFLAELRREGFTRREPPVSTPRRRFPDGTLGDPLPAEATGVMVGETPGVGVELGRLLSGVGRGEMDLIFNFDVLDTPGKTRWSQYRFDPSYLKRYYVDYASRLGDGDWLAVFLDNHDNPRMLSKIAGGTETDPHVRRAVAKLLAAIQLTMRGTPFLYQGQELGAINQNFVGIDALRDIESINRYTSLIAAGITANDAWAEVLAGSRDHARVPMRWTPEGGFTTGTPWLAGTDDAVGFSAAEQACDAGSVLSWHRELIRLRREHPALRLGEIEWLHPRRRRYIGYLRTLGEERVLIECNISPKPLRRPNVIGRVKPLLGGPRGRTMAPWEATVSLVG